MRRELSSSSEDEILGGSSSIQAPAESVFAGEITEGESGLKEASGILSPIGSSGCADHRRKSKAKRAAREMMIFLGHEGLRIHVDLHPFEILTKRLFRYSVIQP